MDLIVKASDKKPVTRLAVDADGGTGSLHYEAMDVKYTNDGAVHALTSGGASFASFVPPKTPGGRWSLTLDPLNVPYIDVGERKRKREADEKKAAGAGAEPKAKKAKVEESAKKEAAAPAKKKKEDKAPTEDDETAERTETPEEARKREERNAKKRAARAAKNAEKAVIVDATLL